MGHQRNCVLSDAAALNVLLIPIPLLRIPAAFGAAWGLHWKALVTFNPSDGLAPLTGRIIGAAITVQRELGPGLLESAYQACFEYQLAENQIRFKRQLALPLKFRGVYVDCGYRVDLLVEDRIIVEVKSVEKLAPIHRAQMITYLKLTGCPVGLLLNFNVVSMRHGIRRILNRFVEPGDRPHEEPSEADLLDAIRAPRPPGSPCE